MCVLTSFLLKIRSQAAMFDDQRPHPQQDPIFCCTWAPTGRQVTGCIVRPAPGCAADFGQLPLAMPAHATKSPFFSGTQCFKAPIGGGVSQSVSKQRSAGIRPTKVQRDTTGLLPSRSGFAALAAAASSRYGLAVPCPAVWLATTQSPH